MKQLITMVICLSWVIGLSAQIPNSFKYQAVVRDNAGQVFVNKAVAFQISILQTSESGAVVYSETHSAQTNAFGLVNLEIGAGIIVSGTFSGIDWGSDSYFVKIELDSYNSGLFTEMGTSQLLSVPYALYAKQSGNGLTISGSAQPGDILYHNGASWVALSKGANGQTLRLDDGKPNWAEPGYALPIVTTDAPTNVMVNAATTGGHIIATGFSDITAKGVCWAITQNPDIEDDKTSDTDGIGAFSSQLNDLQPNTTYYARAYASNGAGTAYGNQVSFKTFQNVVFPTVTTAAATNITANAATSGGNITATGGGEITARGVCWSDHQNPTVSDSKTEDGDDSGQFQSQISGLVPGTFYVRAYATNSSGTGYGNMVTFSTEKTLPVLTTKNITDVSAMGAVSGGSISSAGGGTISARGICWSDSPNPTITNEKTGSPATSASFSAAIAKAAPNTKYYIKAYATNEIGTGYGDEKTFTTSDAQYYTSFETGMTPINWSGSFTVSTKNAFEGSYSFKSLNSAPSSTTFTANLSSSGQISFYYTLVSGGGPKLDFYIDDILIESFVPAEAAWRQFLANLEAGTHTFRWQYNTPGYSIAECFIDQITITK